MNLIQMIMKLLRKFAPIGDADYAKMNEEANEWYDKIRTDDEALSNPKSNKLLIKIKKGTSMWYAKAGFALLYVILSVWIAREIKAVAEGDSAADKLLDGKD